jgi:hypothetical protein
MKSFYIALGLFFCCLNAFALGPIPNGTYSGTETCNGYSFPSSMTLTDTTMDTGAQLNEFSFGPDSHGFFTIKPLRGMTGIGLGHFTENGMHFEVTYDFPEKDGTTHPAPGEDTFTHANGVIHMESTASAGPKGKFTCSGDFAKVK